MCPAAVTTDPKLTPAPARGRNRARVSISSRCGAQQNECPKNGVAMMARHNRTAVQADREGRLCYEGIVAVQCGPIKCQEHAVPVDAAESGRSRPGITGIIREVAENISRWFAVISAHATSKYFLRSRESGSVVPSAERGGDQTIVVANAFEKTIATATKESFTTPAPADVKPELPILPTAPDQDEIERRRTLVRKLFNDFWGGVYEKPAGFAARFDQAEDYLNERLAADGEIWQLDATTRAQLGLPARLNSRDNGKDTAARH